MKIIKYPKEFDPNMMIEEEIKKKYGVCPFCGENRKHTYEKGKYIGIGYYSYHTRFGKQKPVWKNILKPDYFWYKIRFTCNSCGAKWESEEFPKIEINEKGITYV